MNTNQSSDMKQQNQNGEQSNIQQQLTYLLSLVILSIISIVIQNLHNYFLQRKKRNFLNTNFETVKNELGFLRQTSLDNQEQLKIKRNLSTDQNLQIAFDLTQENKKDL